MLTKREKNCKKYNKLIIKAFPFGLFLYCILISMLLIFFVTGCKKKLILGDEYIGEYLDLDVSEPNLTIEKNSDGTYKVDIGIYRLANFDDCVGKLSDEGLVFTSIDPAGNTIDGIITVSGDAAIVKFTSSKWDYIRSGDEYKYIRH